MLGRVVDGGVERGHLAGYAGDVDDGLAGGFGVGFVLFGGGGGGGEEVGDCELGCADRMGEVDVEAGVAIGGWIVFGRRFAGRMPEIGKGLCGKSVGPIRRDWVVSKRTGS